METKYEVLRRRAEQLLNEGSALREVNVADFAQAVHELNVYQTELEIQNEELRLSQAEAMRVGSRYRALYNDAPIGYVTLDLDGNITEANIVAQTIINGQLHTFSGKGFAELLYVADRALFTAFLQNLLEQGDKHWIEVRAISPNTFEPLHLRMEATCRKDGGGTPVDVLVAILDITPIRRAQQALQELTRTLEKRVEQQTQVANRRAEQLRAMMIQLNETESRERRQLAAELHDYLAQILVAAGLKVGLVRRALNQSQYDHELRTVETLLAEATQYVRTMMSELSPVVLRESGLVAALHYLAGVMGDQGLKVQVTDHGSVDLNPEMRDAVYGAVRELLHNSVKHSGSDVAYVDIKSSRDVLEVRVRDTGKGADAASLESADPLREKFGLFHIRERMEAMDGELRISTAPGRGMMCTLRLPLICSSRHAGSEADQQMIEAGIRLIVVDDHSVLRQGLISYFSTVHDVHVVGEAESADAAVELTRTLRPDAVLMDINLDGMTGVEATRLLKKDYPELVILGLSMRDDDVIRNEMREAGAAGHFSKDISIDEIANELRRVCGRQN